MSKSNIEKLSGEDMEALRIGTYVLATGGGGDPFQVALNSKLLARDKGLTASMIDVNEIDDDANVACVFFMGAPLVNLERLQNADQGVRSLRRLEEITGEKIDALLPLEVGGGNGMMSFPASQITGLPVIDADCMGRAYPRYDQITMVVKNEDLPKVVISDARNNFVYYADVQSWKWGERLMRNTCSEMGALGYVACMFKGIQAKRSAIRGTMTHALEVGRNVMKANKENQDPIQAIVDSAPKNQLVFEGKVIDVERRIAGGFLAGKMKMHGLGKNAGDEMLVHFQNEWTVAYLNGEVFITAPDLLCIMDSVSGEGVGTDTVRYGQRLSAVAMPIDPIYLTPEGLAAVGPRAFGFDFDYQSFFE